MFISININKCAGLIGDADEIKNRNLLNYNIIIIILYVKCF